MGPSQFRHKWFMSIVASVLILVALSGCQQTTSAGTAAAAVAPPKGLVSSGTLTYGTAATFPPFEYQQNGQFTGFDIDMGQALAHYMGLQVHINNMDFDGLIPALQGSRVDIINSAMYMNPQRATQVDFIPYMKLGDAIVVRAGNPKGIHTLDDLSGLTVAVTRGAIEETYADQENSTLKSEGKPQMTIVALPTANDAVLATQQGRADAFFTSTPGAAYLLKTLPGSFEIAGTFANNTTIGIAVRKGDSAMKQAIEAALKHMVDDGTYAKLMAKYNLPAASSYFPAASGS